MLLHAAAIAGLNLANSVIVGDKVTDLEAGFRAGLRAGALVMTGYGESERHNMHTVADAGFCTCLATGLSEALDHLLDGPQPVL